MGILHSAVLLVYAFEKVIFQQKGKGDCDMGRNMNLETMMLPVLLQTVKQQSLMLLVQDLLILREYTQR